MKFLVFATDLPPIPGAPTSGTALRTWGLCEGLRAAGNVVRLAPPKQALGGFLDRLPADSAYRRSNTKEFAILEELKSLAFDPANQTELIEREQPDVLICGHWPAMMLKRKPDQPLILDLAGPHMLERHYQQSADQTAAILVKLGIIATADLFIVSGPSQREYFRSFLQRAGVTQISDRFVTIPMPLSPQLPQRPGISDRYPHFIFGGVFLPWQDPSHALNFAADQIEKRGRGHLTLIGGKHPNYEVTSDSYRKLFAKLEKHSFVTVKPMLPYEALCQELLHADVALDLMGWNIERQLAVTIRSTTYLWSGLPVIYNDYADLSRDILRFDAGWAVPPEDDAALLSVFDSIYSNPSEVSRRSQNATRLARDVFSWTSAAESLLQGLNSYRSLPRQFVDLLIDAPEHAECRLGPQALIEQRFTVRHHGTSFVDCRVATHGHQITEPLTIQIFDLGTSQELAKQRFEPTQLSDNSWIRIHLHEETLPAGTELRIEARSQDPHLALWAARYVPFPLSPLKWNGAEITWASLCLRTGGHHREHTTP